MRISVQRPVKPVRSSGSVLKIIEAGMNRNASLEPCTQNRAVACLFTSKTANGTKTLDSIAIWLLAASGSPVTSYYLYNTTNGEPSGDWASKGGALATHSSTITITSTGFLNFPFASGYAIQKDVQYALMLTHPTAGGSFTIGYNPNISVQGWGYRVTITPQNNIEDSSWNYDYPYTPIIQLNFSDGSQETCHVAASSGSAGTPDLYGTDRFSGILIRPDEDLLVARVAATPEYSGTAGSAGALVVRFYDDAKSLIGETGQLVATEWDAANRRHRFFPDPVASIILRQNRTYYVLGTQVSGGGSASHFMRMGASVGGSYTTNAFPPENVDQNQYHGLVSVSSTTGLANVAFNGTVCPYMSLLCYPWRR